MAVTRFRGLPARTPGADVWRQFLSHIPTAFGRLIYLASLRDSNTGRYEHDGLALQAGFLESERALAQAHLAEFRDWIAQPVSAQKRDLDGYLSAISKSKTEVISAWSALQPYRNLVPATASATERLLFCSDFEALLGLLRNVYGVAPVDPDA